MPRVVLLAPLLYLSAAASVPSAHSIAPQSPRTKGTSPALVCKDSDQNVLIQGKLHVSRNKEESPATKEESPAMKEDKNLPYEGLVTPMRNNAKLSKSPIEKFATAPGKALQQMADNVGPPRGWFLIPAMGSIFILFMQCTDVHADSYGMEDDAIEDTTHPPQRSARLPLFDIARFGLLVGVIWTQFLLAFGNDIIASTVHEFVWPTWFFLAGIFGSSMAYESVGRIVCYSFATNCLLACIGALLAFFNYRGALGAYSSFVGGAWVLWCLLFYRLTITPLFHAAKTLRIPVMLLLGVIHCSSYASRLRMPTSSVVVDLHPHQVEHLLLMVKSLDATVYSGLLNAPYFAAGLLMSATQWNDLFSSTWFKCVAAANAFLWCVLTVTPLLCTWGQWRCPERPYGVKLLIHADSLSGFWEDVACYLTRMSAVLLILCLLFACGSLSRRWVPKLATYIEECGSRIRYTLVLFVVWYMIHPCMLRAPQLPFQRSPGMSDASMGCPALFLALVLTSTGTQQLFRWLVEPYWAKSWLEGCFGDFFKEFYKKPVGHPFCGPQQCSACFTNPGGIVSAIRAATPLSYAHLDTS